MTGVLDGVTVIDLSRVLAAPFATQMLSDLGATILKVEALSGDHTRTWGQHYFDTTNRGKHSIAVNLKDERGQEIVRSLAEQADVFVENFKVGEMETFGLDYPKLSRANEGIIYLSMTGFGQTGPRRREPGYDSVIQAMTGIMSATGDPDRPPNKVGIAWIDVMAGLTATSGVLAALYERGSSGRGQHIDLSLFDVGIMALIDAGMDYLHHGNVQTRTGGVHRNFAPAQPFRAADGWVTIAVGTDDQFHRMCHAMELPELVTDPRFDSNANRLRHREELGAILAERFALEERTHWFDTFARDAIPLSAINDIAEALGDDQSAARDVVWHIATDDDEVPVLANPLQHMSRTPARAAGPPPRLGQHTREILTSTFGFDDTKIAALASDHVIRVAEDAPVMNDSGRQNVERTRQV